MKEHIVMHHDDVRAVNTEENPDNVVPAEIPVSKVSDGKAEIRIQPLSWNVIRFA